VAALRALLAAQRRRRCLWPGVNGPQGLFMSGLGLATPTGIVVAFV